MTQEELVALYPRLWHMAHEGSWPSIRDRGLMSVSAMLDEYNVPDKERVLLSPRIGQSVLSCARQGSLARYCGIRNPCRT